MRAQFCAQVAPKFWKARTNGKEKFMSTALLNRIATLKERVARLEKTWGIKKAASGIGEPITEVFSRHDGKVPEVNEISGPNGGQSR
jgi:hypothetical protein